MFTTSLIYGQYNSVSQYTGSFSRMGFSARGIAMGNSLSSVLEGDLSGYYNPAISSFQKGINFSLGYTILSLDRSLNFLSFGKSFELGKKRDAEGNWTKPKSIAGIYAGIVNSGVSGIEERDNQGIKSGDISTSENLFFIAVSNQFSDHISVGLNIKFYYYKLYQNVTSTGVGLDAGIIYRYNNNLNFAFVISDINSKYKWNTTDLYGQYGSLTENKFPLRKKFAASYLFNQIGLLLAAEIEAYDGENNFVRFGTEYNIIDGFRLRAGLDGLNISNSEIPVKPSFGFGYQYILASHLLGIDYTYGVEPYSPLNFHVLAINFKL